MTWSQVVMGHPALASCSFGQTFVHGPSVAILPRRVCVAMVLGRKTWAELKADFILGDIVSFGDSASFGDVLGWGIDRCRPPAHFRCISPASWKKNFTKATEQRRAHATHTCHTSSVFDLGFGREARPTGRVGRPAVEHGRAPSPVPLPWPTRGWNTPPRHVLSVGTTPDELWMSLHGRGRQLSHGSSLTTGATRKGLQGQSRSRCTRGRRFRCRSCYPVLKPFLGRSFGVWQWNRKRHAWKANHLPAKVHQPT